MGAKAGELREVPGPKTREWCERNKRVSLIETDPFRLVFKAGEGCCLIDVDGNEYLDFGSPGTNIFGYGEWPRKHFLPLVDLICRVGIVRFPTTDWGNTETIKAKEFIQKSVPLSGRGLVGGKRAGTLAIEAAIKALRKARPNRNLLVSFWGGFHGRSHAALSLIDPHKPERLEQYHLPYLTIRLKFPYLGHPNPEMLVDKEFGKFESDLRKVSGLFIELIQGEGGIRVIDPLGIKRIAYWCHRYDIPMVFDEIQTGMGRTGSRWSYEQFGVLPEIVTLGKGLGGNWEDCNAVVIREDLAFRDFGAESSTYGLSPLEAMAAVESLNLLEAYRLAERAKKAGEKLGELLSRAFDHRSHNRVKEIRGVGLMWGVEFTSDAFRNGFIKEAEKRGLLLLGAGFSEKTSRELVCGPTVRFMPPLIVSDEEIYEAVSIACAAYTAVQNR